MRQEITIPYFVLWKWRSDTYRTKYSMANANACVWMMSKHGVPLDRIILVTDDPAGAHCRTFPLWKDFSDLANISGKHLPSCYRRLKIFHAGTREQMGIPIGQRVCSMDLDCVITQNFLDLHQRREPYVGWKVPGARHRVVMNGSMFMFTAGQYDWLWDTFDPVKSPKLASENGYMGSDQGYLSHQLVQMKDTGGWTIEDGVLSYQRDIIRMRTLPRHTRIVFFAGKQKPWDADVLKRSNWILRYVPGPGSEPPKQRQAAPEETREQARQLG